MKQKQKLVFLVPALVLCATIVVAVVVKWSWRDTAPHISLSEWTAIKPVETKGNRFRFAIASMISVEKTWVTYKQLVDYVASCIGEKGVMVLRPSYHDVCVLLKDSEIDLAFVCTGSYVICLERGNVELLVVPEFKDNLKYRSLFIARKDSTITNIQDLRNKSFAFTDPESNTGCIVPTWVVQKYGLNPNAYFSKIIYTGSHDRSIRAVAIDMVDAAAVDSLVYYSFLRTYPDMKDKFHVIWQSEAFGAPPVVVPAGLSESTKEKLRDVFLAMSQNAQGSKILEGLGIECFRKPEPGEYDSAYTIWKATDENKGT